MFQGSHRVPGGLRGSLGGLKDIPSDFRGVLGSPSEFYGVARGGTMRSQKG